MTTLEMRIPSRPPVVGQAAALLWTAAALFAWACVAKWALGRVFSEIGSDAQFRVANAHNYDPDLLEYVPFYLDVAGFLVALCYTGSALWFALAARSVARGRPRSLTRTVSATVNVAIGLAFQPLVWFSLPESGDAKGQQVLDRIAEETPWWVHAGDALALVAFIIAIAAIVKLCSNDARWFRGALD
ncbi:hypothetical protein [Glycomyces sp. NPDC048151]|uniref:hypothetical protein n=1 Tax=Glycomyces sp. NPDC048151 TaxID=3364002 RepID=UPI00371A7339